MENTTMNVLESASGPSSMMLLFTSIAGGIFLIFYMIRRSRSRQDTQKPTYHVDSNEFVPRSNTFALPSTSASMQPREFSNKRAKNKKRREVQQERIHPWNIGTLKGHTGLVNDMNFSSNGRYLATCADDENLRETKRYVQCSGQYHMYKKKEPKKKTSSSLQGSEKQSSARREDTEARKASRNKNSGSAVISQRNVKLEQPPANETGVSDDDVLDEGQHQMMYLNDAYCLTSAIHKYALSQDELFEHGYPLESLTHPGYAEVNNVLYPTGFNVAGNYNGQYNNSSSSEQEGLSDNERKLKNENSRDKEKRSDESCSEGKKRYERKSSCENEKDGCESSSDSEKSSDNREIFDYNVDYDTEPLERTCVRCQKIFYVNQNGQYLRTDHCIYHSGKLHNRTESGKKIYFYTCCNQNRTSRGCAEWEAHVWTGLVPGINGPLEGYVCTMPSPIYLHDNNYGVYAMDCEMCYTLQGLELARVTVVDLYGQVVYDTLVKPRSRIVDYNTKFSGITEEDMINVTKTLPDVQNDLLNFVYAQTILMGHSLANDLRALRLIHKNVIDTSVIFPHHLGLPYRNGLKALARFVLGREIQEETHNSIEDAQVVVDLVLAKAQYEWQQFLKRS